MSSALLEAARAHLAPTYAQPPFVATRGEGAFLWDEKGRKYLDLAGGLGANALGHAHPVVVEAIKEQAERLCHTSNLLHHRGHIEMCARLSRLSFGDRCFLTNSGTEAMEAALKTARRFFHVKGTPRTAFVATHGAFHGRSYGALSISGQPFYQEGFGPLLAGTTLVPFGDEASLDAMREAVRPDTAAVILEPIQGNAGVRVPEDGYLRRVCEICDAAGCLLIIDEIQTGLGRTGRWFAHEHDGITPDIMTLAKALGGGLPLGAMVTTDEIAQALTTGRHGTTFGGNPVACAAGLATLDVIEQEGLVERAAALGELAQKKLRPLADRHTRMTEVRGRGMIIGVVVPGGSKALLARCRARGLLGTTAGPDVLRLFPPLCATEDQIEQMVQILDAALAEDSAGG